MRVSLIPLVLLLLAAPQLAAANNKQTVTVQPDDEQPDAELLEFIAEFEPLDGHWIDPIQLNMVFAKFRKGEEND